MSPPRLPTVLRAVATAALWLMCSLPLLAAGDAELIAAAQAVAQNGAAADPAMRALIIARNKDFQRLSLNSRNISANVFEKCQAWYVETMTQYAREEGAKLGIVVHTQASVAKPAKPGQKYVEFQPGTDLDLITDATTPEQIADLQKKMNDRISKEVKANLPNAPQASSWVHANDIDMMADPTRTTPENFKKICDQNNFAYERPGAARFEAWKRELENSPATAKAVSFDDLGDYLDEMKSGSARRGEQIAGVQSELRDALRSAEAKEGGEAALKKVQQLQEDLYILQAQQSKLVERINDATDTLLKTYPVPEGTVLQGSTITKHGKTRDMLGSAHAPGLANQLNEEMLQDAYKRNAEALAAIAKKNPEAAEACAAQIRKTSQNLTPKQKVELIDYIRNVHGEDAANAMKSAVFGQAADGLSALGGKLSGPYTIKSTSATAREAAETVSAALAKGSPREAMAALEEMHVNMKKARDLASLPGAAANTGLEEFVDEYSRIRASASSLPLAEQSKFIDGELNKLFSRGAFKDNLANAVKTGAREAELLQAMAGERDSMRKAVIREMLEGKPGATQELWEKISTLADRFPLEHILTAVFVYYDTVSSARLQGEGKADEAARKAVEALAGALGSPVLGLVTVIGNLIIDAAKDAGYSIATNPQDMDDLLAGIISVKGWESAEGFGAESSIDKLAIGFTNEDEVKRAVENAIARAAANSSDTPEVRDGKTKDLLAKMIPKVLAAWRAKREEFVKDFLDLLPALDQLMDGISLQPEFNPAPIPLLKRKNGDKSASGSVRVSLEGPMEDLRSITAQLEARLRKLGGYKNVLFLSVRQKVTWSVDDQPQAEQQSIGMSPLLLDKTLRFKEAGAHTVACDVTWELIPISGITDSADFRGRTFVLNPVKKVSYKADTGLQVDWQTPGFKETFTPGDVVARHSGKMKRTYTRSGGGSVDVVDNGEDDSIAVTIAGKPQVMPGETAVLTPEFNCAEAVDAKGLSFRWSGPVRAVGDTALFQQTKPGSYTIGLAVFRGEKKGAVKVADALPFVIDVLRPDDAAFSLRVKGATQAKVVEEIDLSATTFCGNTEAERLLENRDIWIEWHVNGQPFETGPSLRTSATAPGTYAFDVQLVWHGEGGDRVLASAPHTVKVDDAETKPPNLGTNQPPVTPDPTAPITGERLKLNPENTKTDAPTTEPPPATPPAPSSASGGSAGSGGGVFYGSTLALTFAPPGKSPATLAADAAFFASLKNQSSSYESGYASDAAAKERAAGSESALKTDSGDDYLKRVDAGLKTSPTPATPPGAPLDWREDMQLHQGAQIPNPGIGSEKNNPETSAGPDSSFLNGPPRTAAPPASPAPTPPPPSGPLRYVFQSAPAVTFTPAESENGATTVTFDRMGDVTIWAVIYSTAAAKPLETPQTTYRVTGPPLTITCTPEGAKIGEEVRGQVTAAPAIPDNLVAYYWRAPPSSERMEYSANADRIGFMPKNSSLITLQVEARAPHYNDIIGTASATYQPAAYSVEAKVVGRLGPRPMIWDPVRGGLIPAPEGTFIVDEAITLRATLIGEPKPDPLRWSWIVNEGATLRSSGLGAETSVSRSEAGSASATVTALDKNNNVLGTATVAFPVAPNEPPLPLTVKLSAGALKIRSGSRTGLQAAITGGVTPYSITWSGASGSGASGVFEAGRAGPQPVTVTVTDKLGATAAATVTLTVEAVPLNVTLVADKRSLLPGEKAALRASAAGGTAPYRFTWTGASGSGDTAPFEGARPGPATVTVSVLDAWDNSGTASCNLEVKTLNLRAEIAGVSGEPVQLWDDVNHLLKPLAAGRYGAGQLVRVRASLLGAALPAGAAFTWSAAANCTLAGAAAGAESAVSLTQKGAAEAGVTLLLNGVSFGTASVKIPVEVSAEEIAASRKMAADWALAQERERQAKALVAEGYAFEKKGELEKALGKYRQAQALKNDPRVAAHIVELEKKLADKLKAKKLIAEGYALEQKTQFPEAITKYQAALSLDENPGVRSHLAELEAIFSRRAKASELLAAGYRLEQAQDWANALATYEAAQKEVSNPKVGDRIAYVKSQMQAASAARQGTAPQPPAPAPSPQQATPAAPAPGLAARYDLNGSYNGRTPMIKNIHWPTGFTIRQTGDAIMIDVLLINLDGVTDGENALATFPGKIVGDRIDAQDLKFRILDGGRTLIDAGNNRYTK